MLFKHPLQRVWVFCCEAPMKHNVIQASNKYFKKMNFFQGPACMLGLRLDRIAREHMNGCHVTHARAFYIKPKEILGILPGHLVPGHKHVQNLLNIVHDTATGSLPNDRIIQPIPCDRTAHRPGNTQSRMIIPTIMKQNQNIRLPSTCSSPSSKSS